MNRRAIPEFRERLLCLVTDIELAGGTASMVDIAGEAARGGVGMVQVRAHSLAVDELQRFASDIVSVVGRDVIVSVNGPLGVALESRASTVHLPESAEDMHALVEQAHLNGLLIGRSVHSAESAGQAAKAGCDYVFMGTVFASRSHPGGAACGVEGIRQAAEAARDIPVVGIGGITAANAGAVIEAGAAGVAVISAIIGASNPALAAQEIATAINSA